MSPTETDIFYSRGVFKKVDALQMFWLFAVAVGVPVVAMVAVLVAVLVAVAATFAAPL